MIRGAVLNKRMTKRSVLKKGMIERVALSNRIIGRASTLITIWWIQEQKEWAVDWFLPNSNLLICKSDYSVLIFYLWNWRTPACYVSSLKYTVHSATSSFRRSRCSRWNHSVFIRDRMELAASEGIKMTWETERRKHYRGKKKTNKKGQKKGD